MRQLFCKNCGLYLGFKIDTSRINLNAEVRVKEKTFPIDYEMLEPRDVDTLDNLYTLLGHYSQAFYLVESYMRWYDAGKEQAQWKFLESKELRCQSIVPSGKRKKKVCGNLIGHSKDVVCKPYHTIDIGAGDEPALYFSRVQEDNLVLGKKQASYVAVGPMYHYEMRCKKCDVLIGLKYANVMVLEHDWRPRNATYEGRYAIGKAAAMKDNEELDFPDLQAEFQLLCHRKGLSYAEMKDMDALYWTTDAGDEAVSECDYSERGSPTPSRRSSFTGSIYGFVGGGINSSFSNMSFTKSFSGKGSKSVSN